MSMSTGVIGIIPPDENFNKMFAAYVACEKAGIPTPKEVDDFFNGESPDKAGVLINMTYDKKYKAAVKEWGDEDRQGIEVDLSKLPKDIKILRFYNSW